MIDESCEVPREDLDEGFNPCRRQVVENGELCQYAHMYDVMNERHDREEDTSYLDSTKRDKITSTTPVLLAGNNTQIYANSESGEGCINMLSTRGFNNPEYHTEASIPSAKAVVDYVAGAVADYAPIPLPISKGGTGGDTPYVTGDLDSSAVFVMHDAPNDRYNATPMSSLTGYLDAQYMPVKSKPIPSGSDLNEYRTPGNYAITNSTVLPSLINKPVNLTEAFNLYVFPVLRHTYYIGQQISAYDGTATYYRYYDSGSNQWSAWTLLYPAHSMDTPPNKFYYTVSPFPSDTWEGEMTINVTPVFSVKIGAYTYVLARVYAYKRFNYTGSADNINLFTSLKPVGDYTGVFSDSTRIPLTFNVFGRSNTDGAYGLTSKGSAANLSFNHQTVSSGFNLGNFDISSNLKCVFGEGSNTPGVAVSVDCMALMWQSVS